MLNIIACVKVVTDPEAPEDVATNLALKFRQIRQI
jgi:hypothetical protein